MSCKEPSTTALETDTSPTIIWSGDNIIVSSGPGDSVISWSGDSVIILSGDKHNVAEIHDNSLTFK